MISSATPLPVSGDRHPALFSAEAPVTVLRPYGGVSRGAQGIVLDVEGPEALVAFQCPIGTDPNPRPRPQRARLANLALRLDRPTGRHRAADLFGAHWMLSESEGGRIGLTWMAHDRFEEGVVQDTGALYARWSAQILAWEAHARTLFGAPRHKTHLVGIVTPFKRYGERVSASIVGIYSTQNDGTFLRDDGFWGFNGGILEPTGHGREGGMEALRAFILQKRYALLERDGTVTLPALDEVPA